LKDELNHIIISMCKYFERTSQDMIESVQSARDLEALYSIRDASALACRKHVPLVRLTSALAKAQRSASHPACMALLTLRAIFSLAKLYGDNVREAWYSIVRIVLSLHHDGLLPASFLEMDDIADSQGHPLPTAGAAVAATAGGGADASGAEVLLNGHKSPHGVNANGKANCRSNFNGAGGAGASEYVVLSPENSGTDHGYQSSAAVVSSTGGGGGMWQALTSFFLPPQNDVDHLHAEAVKAVQATLQSCDLAALFSRSRMSSKDSLVHLMSALLLPFESAGAAGVASAASGGDDANGNNDDNVDGSGGDGSSGVDMVLCLELLTGLALVNTKLIEVIFPVVDQAIVRALRSCGILTSTQHEHGSTRSSQGGLAEARLVSWVGSVGVGEVIDGVGDDGVGDVGTAIVETSTLFVLERVTVNVLRMCVRLLDMEGNVGDHGDHGVTECTPGDGAVDDVGAHGSHPSGTRMGSDTADVALSTKVVQLLDFLTVVPDSYAEHLGVRVGSGLATVLKLNSGVDMSRASWRVLQKLFHRFAGFSTVSANESSATVGMFLLFDVVRFVRVQNSEFNQSAL
jgi:hypothetical protein